MKQITIKNCGEQWTITTDTEEIFNETMRALYQCIEGSIKSVTITFPTVDVIFTAGFLQNSLITITKQNTTETTN